VFQSGRKRLACIREMPIDYDSFRSGSRPIYTCTEVIKYIAYRHHMQHLWCRPEACIRLSLPLSFHLDLIDPSRAPCLDYSAAWSRILTKKMPLHGVNQPEWGPLHRR